MPDLQEDAPDRRFIPTPANSKPSDLFLNTSATTFPIKSARFVNHEGPKEYLIFISGLSASVGTAPERAVYAYVWGPYDYDVADLEHNFDPQTAERAKILAATKALRLVAGWCNDVLPPRSVVLAFSGNYFLNQVARSDVLVEVRKERDNLDMKFSLEVEIMSLRNKGVTVRFCQIDKDNMAEDLAYTYLYGNDHLLYKAVKTIVNWT